MEPDDRDPISETGDEERQEAVETDDSAVTAEPDSATSDQSSQASADRPPEASETGPTAADGGHDLPAVTGVQVDDPTVPTPLQDDQTSPAANVPVTPGKVAAPQANQGDLTAHAGRHDDLGAGDDVTVADQQQELPPTQPAPIDLPWPSAAEAPAASSEAAAWSMGADRSGTSGWGALWRQSAQGWVEDPAGRAVWRPIVTTSATLSEWEVDTYLGLVTGELAVSVDNLEGGLRSARQDAVERMVDDALARGAHAVIGVSVDLLEVAGRVVVSAAGTAVTLKTSE